MLTTTIEKYVKALQKGDTSEQFYALSELRRLSSADRRNKDVIRTAGAIKATVALLGSPNTHIRSVALSLLRSLSVNYKNQVAIATVGAIPMMLRFLQSDDETTQANAAAILWNLAADAENKATIGDVGGVSLLLKLLQKTQSIIVQAEVCGALRNLSFRYENLAYFAQHPRAISVMVELLAAPPRFLERGGAEKTGERGRPTEKGADRERADAAEARQEKETMAITLRQNIRKDVAAALNLCMEDERARRIIEGHHCMKELLDALKEFRIGMSPPTAEYVSPINQPPPAPPLRLSTTSSVSSSKRQAENEKRRGRAAVITTRRGAGRTTVAGAERERAAAAVADRGTTSLAAQSALQPLSSDVFGSIAWKRLELEEMIGKGSFSEVYRARYHGFVVAAKLLKDSLPDEQSQRDHLLQEYRMMAALRHPNVVLLMGTSINPQGRPVFVSELCSRGALKDVLPEEKSLLRRLKFGKDIVAGLNWLHAHNIIHRDLKCANILVDEEYKAKISDLGLALLYYDGVPCTHFRGNLKYSAPEILRARANRKARRYPYGPQTDVYSFGLILWELQTRQPLFHGIHGSKEITTFVCEGNRPPLVPCWPMSLQNMLTSCWHDTPARRPSFIAIQKDFPTVMIDTLCPDPTARIVCRELWGGAEMRIVPYNEFEAVFGRVTHIDWKNASLCFRRCLQKMLCDSYDQNVTFERVCNMVHTFGAMHSIQTFLNNLITLFEQPWFFGYVGAYNAQAMLTEQWKLTSTVGYYMIRFSDSNPGGFTLMTIDGKTGAIESRRIGHHYLSEYYVTINNQPHMFRTLFALHDYCVSAPSVCNNKRVLPGSPFACLFVSNPLQPVTAAAVASSAEVV